MSLTVMLPLLMLLGVKINKLSAVPASVALNIALVRITLFPSSTSVPVLFETLGWVASAL